MKVGGLILQTEPGDGPKQSAGRGLWAGMTAGRSLSARVVSVDPGGFFTLDIAGNQVIARSDLKLLPGEILNLKVKEAGPPPVLVPDFPPGGRSVSALFSSLLELFDLEDPARFAAAMDIATGRSAVSPLPPMAEKSSAEAILRLMSALLPDRHGEGEGLSLPDEGHMSRMESGRRGEIVNLMRQFNTAALAAGRQPCFAFPFIYQDQDGYGAFFFSRQGKGAGDENDSAGVIDFFLVLSALGEVRARIALADNGVNGGIWLSDEAARQHLRKDLAPLSDRLAQLAGREVFLQVHKGPPALKAELARVMALGGDGLLDARV